MKEETIRKIEKEFPKDGLQGMLFHHLNGKDKNKLTEVASLPDGSAGLVMKGSAPIFERRKMFLDLYEGCGRVADVIKKDVGYSKDE